MIQFKKVIFSFLNQVAGFFPYFFVFYLLCFIVSLFSSPWRLFFDWDVFNFSVVLLGMLSIASPKFRNMAYDLLHKESVKKSSPHPAHFKKAAFVIVRLLIVVAALYLAMQGGAGRYEIFILVIGLLWFLFAFDVRFLALAALALFIACPILLSIGKDAAAEQLSVYAYYVMVATAFCLAANLLKDIHRHS